MHIIYIPLSSQINKFIQVEFWNGTKNGACQKLEPLREMKVF